MKCSANWKQLFEIRADTESSISAWTPQEKIFRLGARSFYIKVACYLLSRLPFNNHVLKDLKHLHPSSVKKESSIAGLGNLVQQVPQVVPPQKVSALMDEITLISTEELSCNLHEWLDDAWQHVFTVMSKESSPSTPKKWKFIKALLSLANGNFDVAKGFSKNRFLFHKRSKLSIANLNGLRKTRPFCNHYGQDASTILVKPVMI